MLPNDDFAERVEAAISDRPESLLLAFVPGFARERRVLAAAHGAGARYCPFTVGAYVPTVAIIYPRDIAVDFLAWADHGTDRYRRPMRGADDGILAYYCRTRRLRPQALVPCAADHDETVGSISKRHVRRGPHRRAALL